MNETLKDILFVAAGSAGAALVEFIRRGINSMSRMRRIEDAIFLLLRRAETNAEAIKASLICQRDGKANGEITEALKKLDEDDKVQHDFFHKATIGRRTR